MSPDIAQCPLGGKVEFTGLAQPQTDHSETLQSKVILFYDFNDSKRLSICRYQLYKKNLQRREKN